MDGKWAFWRPLDPSAKSRRSSRNDRYAKVVNAILYIGGSAVSGGTAEGLPPSSTCEGYFYSWRDTDSMARLKTTSLSQPPGTEDARPLQRPFIESQSQNHGKLAGSLAITGQEKSSSDAKRHISPTPRPDAFVLDSCPGHSGPGRRARCSVNLRHRFPWLRHVFADGATQANKLRTALSAAHVTIEIIKRSDLPKASTSYPAMVWNAPHVWTMRRLAKDWRNPSKPTRMGQVASIRLHDTQARNPIVNT